MTEFSRFDQVLESIERLSLEEQEALVQVVRRRIIEKRRDEIVENIAHSKVEYAKGEVFHGQVSEIMNKLNQ